MKKSFKDLFIISDEKTDNKQSAPTKFPETKSDAPITFPKTESVISTPIPLECASQMESVMKTYEDGFAKLNQPGVEFFEFFQAVIEGGSDKPDTYKMAFKMMKSLEKSMSKDSLIEQSQFYINELSNVHANYNSIGNKKKNELLTSKQTEDQKLRSEVQLLRQQLDTIKEQISSKELLINQIDGKYLPKITELDCTIKANDVARDRIIASLNSVVIGIKNNL